MKLPLPKGRLLILLGAMVALLSGLDAALLRLGLKAPVASMDLASLHGVLMIFGFLGAAITLERAVALQSDRRRISLWAFLSPVAAVAGTSLALTQIALHGAEATRLLPALAWSASMALLVGIYVVVWRKQPMIAVLIQALGAVAGLAGILLWGRGFEIAQIVPWWCAFLIFTIIGERLELARITFARGSTEARVLGEVNLTCVGLVMTLFAPALGYPLLGLALVIVAIDTAHHDIALRTIRLPGAPRFMAACMLAGYAWMIVAGSIWVIRGPVFSGYGYDTVVHALTIGFALSMVLAHAPVIIPAIARRDLPYNRAMWAVWGSLQLGFVVRGLAGAPMAPGAWQFGGALDIAGVLAFVVVTVTTIVIAGRPRTKPTAKPTAKPAGKPTTKPTPAAEQTPEPSPEAAK